MKIAFIGLGNMGGGMAANLVKAGHSVNAFDLSADALDAAKANGCTPFTDAREACADVEAVVTMLPNGGIVKSVYEGSVIGTAPAGAVLLDCSTIDVATAKETIAAAESAGYAMVDAPVSGGAPAVEAGTLLVMVGGADEVVERCRPVFATYADPIVHLGPLGAGQSTKILNNLLFSANLGSAVSTLELGESLGIARDKLVEVLNRGSATSKAVGSISMFGGTLEGLAPIAGALLQKDVRHAASLASAASAPEGAVFSAADAALNAMEYAR